MTFLREMDAIGNEMNLEAAADVILEQLDPPHADLIREMSRENHQSPAAYIIACLKFSKERGEMVFNLGYVDIPATPSTIAAQATTAICDWCKEPFRVTRSGQKYCPEPKTDGAESCSRQAAMAPLRARRKPVSQFAPKPAVARLDQQP